MNRDEIREWLIDYLADHLGISPIDVEFDRSLGSYGFDADDVATLVSAIEEYFEETLDADAIRSRSTVATATRYLCELTGADDDEGVGSGDEPMREMDMEEIARDIGLQ
jgi:acyl carrier protein